MKNLRLVSDIHHQQAFVKASFSFNPRRHAFKYLHETKKLILLQIHLGHENSKTTELYTYISKKSLAKIKSTLDQLIQQ